MNQKREKPQREEETRTKKRIAVLILSGLLVIVILPVIAVYASLQIDSWLNLPRPAPEPFNLIIAAVFLAVGFFWAGWSNVDLFRKGEGTPVPREGTQTRRLVTSGAYRYTRNPMVFGYMLTWIGLGFLFNSLFLTIGVTSIVTAGLIAFVKLWEEKNLEKRFGEPYIQYKKKVSFLIPLPPKKQE